MTSLTAKIIDALENNNHGTVYGVLTPATVNLKCFIVPNSPISLMVSSPRLDFIAHDQKAALDSFGIKFIPGEEGIQVWIHDDSNDNSNWTDHGIPSAYANCFDGDYAPSYMPYSIIKDVKEGDVLTFTNNHGTTINMVFEQLPYRYRRFGRFEDTVAALQPAYQKQKAWEQEQGMILHQF